MPNVYYVVMRYGQDLRRVVVKYVREGGNQTEAAQLFGVSRKTIYRWLHGDEVLSAHWRGNYKSKLDKVALAAHVRDYPDALLRERAAHFNVTHVAIWRALKRQNITKKNDTLSRE